MTIFFNWECVRACVCVFLHHRVFRVYDGRRSCCVKTVSGGWEVNVQSSCWLFFLLLFFEQITRPFGLYDVQR